MLSPNMLIKRPYQVQNQVMKRRILGFLLIAFVIGSCTTVRVTSRTIDASRNDIIVKPMLAEVEVDLNKKVTGTATIRGLIKSKKTPISQIKKLAHWDACEKSGADIIVDPVYKITKKIGSVTVEVFGFYGKYKSVETVQPAELENLNLYTMPSGSGGIGGGTEGGGGFLKRKLKKMKG